MADEHGQLLVGIRTKRPGPPRLDTAKRVTLTVPTRQSLTSRLSGTTRQAHTQSHIGIKPFNRHSAASNNMKLVHWPLMGGLLHLLQR